MYNYIITLDNKKEKSSFLNKLDFFNKMVKNLFNTVFYDASGKIYSSNLSLGGCKCYCETKGLVELFQLNENDLIELYPNEINECIKNGKTKIEFIEIENNEITMVTTEKRYVIGQYITNDKLDFSLLTNIKNKSIHEEECNNLIDCFKEKKFIDFKVSTNNDEYRMFLTHKLFANITKINNITVSIVPNEKNCYSMSKVNDHEYKVHSTGIPGEKTFYSIFKLNHEYKDCFINIYYFYHFVKI